MMPSQYSRDRILVHHQRRRKDEAERAEAAHGDEICRP